MNIRPVQRADASALVHLWNQSACHDPMTPSLLQEKLWGDADFDPELGLVAAEKEDEDIGALAVGVCRECEIESTGFVKMLAVAPDLQHQGIGTQLLTKLEQQMSHRGVHEVRLGESAPNYLTPGVDVRYAAAHAFFERNGYHPIGEACNLRVDLENRHPASESTLQPGGKQASYDCFRASGADEAGLRKLVCEHWPAWWDEVSVALANSPITVFIACRGGSIVAFAAHDANNRGTGWFGPMGTAPAHRGHGVGARLLRLCLDDMAAAGFATATIPWVGPVEFYKRTAGARLDRTFIRYSKQLDSRSNDAR